MICHLFFVRISADWSITNFTSVIFFDISVAAVKQDDNFALDNTRGGLRGGGPCTFTRNISRNETYIYIEFELFVIVQKFYIQTLSAMLNM